MDPGFSVSSKKIELASQSSTIDETTSEISETSDINQKRNVLEDEGYKKLKRIVNDDNVTVITARASDPDRIVTIKIMSKAGNSGFCRKKGFYKEIEMMKQLNHPNLIKYHRSIETVNRFYIVMECAQKGSLSDLIRSEKYLTEPKARKIYRQLASVLSYCNSRGCNHHDIKSETILFDANDVLKISIFGYSYRSMLNHSIVVDTDCESASLTEPDYADIYGSGVVLFEMVYGKLPRGYSNVSLKHSLRCVHFPEEPDVTPMCKSLISGIIVPQADNRISWNDIIDSEWMKQQDMVKVDN